MRERNDGVTHRDLDAESHEKTLKPHFWVGALFRCVWGRLGAKTGTSE